MSSSIPKIRFLLDENVRIELVRFLKSNNIAIKQLPKGTSDKALAAFSKQENMILVTNDEDFSYFTVRHRRLLDTLA